MNKRKIQAVINRIKGDIVKYNKEIDYIIKIILIFTHLNQKWKQLVSVGADLMK